MLTSRFVYGRRRCWLQGGFFPSDGLWWWRWWRLLRGSIGEVCLPQLDAFVFVVLHPILSFPSSASMDFGLKTAGLFFFFTCVDVWSFLEFMWSIRASAYCLLRLIHELGPPHRLGSSKSSLCFLCSLLHASEAGAEGFGATGSFLMWI